MSGPLWAAAPDPSALVTNTVFVAFDTETTGLSPKRDRLVEIGAVKFRGNGEILSETNWLINPERDIPMRATEVHGIRTGDVLNAPLFKEMFPAFAEFCDGSVLLAHNAPFDVNFVQAELKRANIDAPAMPVLDTLPLFRVWFPHALSHALGKLATYLNVDKGVYHRAEADSYHIVDVMGVGMKHRSQLQLKRMEDDAGGFIWLDGKKH
jgi:DNA polymerase-3 subunit epsilon